MIDTWLINIIDLGLQGEDCRHTRRDSTKEARREAPGGHHLPTEGMVAISFKMAIPYCK